METPQTTRKYRCSPYPCTTHACASHTILNHVQEYKEMHNIVYYILVMDLTMV
jgi:hypothetical protein